MKCPNCKKVGSCKYIIPRIKSFVKPEDKRAYKRTDHRAKCNKCKWEGII